jgi:thiamine-monophosphate kinase
MKSLEQLGEFGLIRQLTRGLATQDSVLQGVGDDCAVLDIEGHPWLVTCDMSVEDIHFRRTTAPPDAIGWKVAAGAISDIAAMGGTPRFVTVAIAIPRKLELSFLQSMYEGMQHVVENCGAVIVGGDTTKTHGPLTIDITVIGDTQSQPLLRSGAKAGDYLAVTGQPGCAAAGLAALEKGKDILVLKKAHLYPMPQLAQGRWFAERQGVHAMIDVSDGVMQDAGHLAECSKLGVNIETALVPLAVELEAYSQDLFYKPIEMALGGGEGYELLVALDGGEAEKIVEEFRTRFPKVPFQIIGQFVSGKVGVTLDYAPAKLQGFDHFKRG